MFTVEYEHDHIAIRSLDHGSGYEDLEVYLENDGHTVFIRQFSEATDSHEVICCSYQQLRDILLALNKSEGMFYEKS